jgi:hypothetical protein
MRLRRRAPRADAAVVLYALLIVAGLVWLGAVASVLAFCRAAGRADAAQDVTS